MFSSICLRIFLITLAIICFFKYNVTSAQDIQFTQFYSVPMFHNPAFAGSVHAPRGTVLTRLQWLGLDANYKTYYVSGDTYLDKYKSGLGFQIVRDVQGSNIYASTQFSLLYSYEIPVSKKFTARLGLQATGVQRTLDYNGLRYPSQFRDSTGYIGGGNYQTGVKSQLYPDFSAGTVIYSDRIWGGFSVQHLNTPEQSFAGAAKDPLAMNFQVTGGYKIPIAQRKYLAYTEDKSEISITPTFHYKSQGKADQLDIGLYGMYNQLMAGVWYRGIPIKHYAPKINNRESVVFLIGWVYKTWNFGYSYDLTISKLTAAGPGGSHEFSITYIHKPVKKHKPMRRLPCPSFYKH
ncbi:MAG: PorP/SprF family type IX secretion system membrane protein [Cytophaga sp.]|uniref:PorP/SprF family type IX secretion system membrane protein n=1 Tax=Cytophaga sp. TaxID=29535 RepID=UPI003F7D0335